MSTAHLYEGPPVMIKVDSPFSFGLTPQVGLLWKAALDKAILPDTRSAVLRTSFVLGKSGSTLHRFTCADTLETWRDCWNWKTRHQMDS
ncbi:MAG: hypothetical protein M2R45_00635 [Verrucomicrobia subdivision 3 bacterium]|nr:hypothetical protein [Limisphaerales bacterium]MCS1414482.1 hypothetical protein [Limisphaerales bacterium]